MQKTNRLLLISSFSLAYMQQWGEEREGVNYSPRVENISNSLLNPKTAKLKIAFTRK